MWILGRQQKTTNKPLSFTIPGRRFIDVSKPEVSFGAEVRDHELVLALRMRTAAVQVQQRGVRYHLTGKGKWLISLSPQLIEAIQKTNFSNYAKGPATHARLEQMYVTRSTSRS